MGNHACRKPPGKMHATASPNALTDSIETTSKVRRAPGTDDPAVRKV